MFRPLLDAFWSESLWLPPNVTWSDVAPGAGSPRVLHTDYRHLWLAVPLAVALLALRGVLDKYIFAPLGKTLGIKHDRNKKVSPNHELEAAYRTNPDSKQVYALAKQLDLPERQVQRWWRRRRLQDKPTTLVKFCESCWRASFLCYNLVMGWSVLWDKDWLWDGDYCYIGYPHQGITNDVWWFYMVALGFYLSQTLSLSTDVRRKDFWQQVIHHAATLSLMSFSWVCNTHRIGTLVMLSHDGSETLLEATKATKYAGYHRASEYMFAVFTALWIATRIGMYSYFVVGSATFRAALFIHLAPMLRVLICLLWVLLALNLFWTWLILQVAYRAIKHGQMEGDIRSSSSEYTDSSTNTRTSRDRQIGI
ncbi:ceramide synthase 6-like isoform X2 [Leguminivora glycinivorella]|nr:ceramide synthase 6-like isoform X2 [Leguminivora glycinivorella]XP_048003853.1 ceramide synthase 6-like isoform X2 [Leguminivora glycinivorella]XP_048003854.1 ceramide synthase 6-like isoform X2 [Leguminivora glycinivorella]XP_048003855.1 ceramide synthase 6-like isoform X2 [Leguminivora glycinivorella]